MSFSKIGKRGAAVSILVMAVAACGSNPTQINTREPAAEQPAVKPEPAKSAAARVVETLKAAPVTSDELQKESTAPESTTAVAKPMVTTAAEPPSPVAAPAPVSEPPAVAKAAPAAPPSAPTAAPSPAPKAPSGPVSVADLKQKIGYANLTMMSGTGKRVAASDNAQAKGMLASAKEKLDVARKELEAGNTAQALQAVDESLQMLNTAARLVPSENVLQEQQQRYDAVRKELQTARTTHKSNFDKIVAQKGGSAGVKYDDVEVGRLETEAAGLATQKRYEDATARLEKAARLVNNATSEMMDSMTIVYQLDLSTPEKEWAYEQQRYKGYEELVGVAIEEKQPNAGQLMLINRSADKGRDMAVKAKDRAAAGEYPVAIRMIRDATDEIRRALRIAGIDQ